MVFSRPKWVVLQVCRSWNRSLVRPPTASILPVETQFSESGCRAPNQVNDLPLNRKLLSGIVFDQDAAVMALGLELLLPCGG